MGLPEADIPLAPLMFNVGMETGQLLFVGSDCGRMRGPAYRWVLIARDHR